MSKELTATQEAFLSHYFTPEYFGDAMRAAIAAGYSKNSVYDVCKALQEELLEGTKLYLAMHGLEAAQSLISIMNDPTQLAAKEKLAAASQVLDRIGVSKADRSDAQNTNFRPIFVLPPKDSQTL